MQAEAPVSHRSLEQLETDLVTRAARINAEEYLFLCDIREFDIRQGWKEYHFNNCAEWLNWRCQLCLGAGREKVRVAHQLFGLPKISDAFRRGIISWSKVRAMTRIADADNEQELLDRALKRTTLEVEQYCLALRNARRDLSTEDANKAYAARYLSGGVHGDGTVSIHAALPREVGELVLAALDLAMRQDDSSGDHDVDSKADAYQARRADALVALAKDYLAGGSDKRGSGAGDNYTVMVHVDESALAGHGGESDLPIETMRRITCDCSLVPIVKDKHGNPFNGGRKHRVVPPATRRAVLARDRACRFPGCSHTRFLEPHHVIHWADGGETNLEDLIALCSRHHRLHHEGGYSVHKRDDGGFVFRNGDGRVIPQAPPYQPAEGELDEDASYDALVQRLAGMHTACEDASRDACRDATQGDNDRRIEEPRVTYCIGGADTSRDAQINPAPDIPSPAFWPASSRRHPAHPARA